MSQKAALLLPMCCLIFLTFGVMFWMLKLRYRAVLKDGLDPKYFRLYDTNIKLPEYLVKVTQHFQNLLEIPPFFYLALVLIVVLDINDTFYVVLSWAFLTSRLVHSYIHTSGNRVMKRKNAFIFSLLILIVLWLRITLSIISL